MKKMKRVLVALLSCLTAFACLAGTVACGKDEKKDSASTPNTSVSESVADSSSEAEAESSEEEAESSEEEVVDSSNEEVADSSNEEVADSSSEEVADSSSEEEVEPPHDCAVDGHNMADVAAIYPTCTTSGRAATIGCTECDYILDPAPEMPKAEDYVEFDKTAYENAWIQYNEYWAKWKVGGTEVQAVGGHAWSKEAVKEVKPTCCEAGVKAYYTCANCDSIKVDGKLVTADKAEEALEIKATGAHKYLSFIHAVEPTCVSDGCTEGWVCANSGNEVVSEYLPALGHNEVYDKENEEYKGSTPATCTKKAHCAVCDKDFGEYAAHELKGVDAQAVTCAADGWEAYEYCVNCSYTTFTSISAKAHWAAQFALGENVGYVKVDKVDATCTEDGNKAHYECSACDAGYYLTAAKTATCQKETAIVLKASGHSISSSIERDSYVAAVAATCVTDGCTKGGWCTKCKEIISSETIPALGHDVKDENGKYKFATSKDATCTEDAYCGQCKKSLNDKNTIGKDKVPVADAPTRLGHTWEEVAIEYASCTATGVAAHYKCSVCKVLGLDLVEGEKDKDANDDGKKVVTKNALTLSAFGHNYAKNDKGVEITVPAKEATCFEDGWNEYKECTRCSYNTKVVISASTVAHDSIVRHAELGLVGSCSEYLRCETFALKDNNKDGVIDENDIYDVNEDGVIDSKDNVHLGCDKEYVNPAKRPHSFNKDNVCELCGTCNHKGTEDDGVCDNCGKCFHAKYENGVCTYCGEVCVDHIWLGNTVNNIYTCKNCLTTCDHTNGHNTDGKCAVCAKVEVGHDWNAANGTCKECGKVCDHVISSTNKTCPTCGYTCDHNNVIYVNGKCACGEVVCEHKAGHYEDGLCKVCDVVDEKFHNYTYNAKDAVLECSCGLTKDVCKHEEHEQQEEIKCSNDKCDGYYPLPKHTFNMDEVSNSGKVKCTECLLQVKYSYACTHEIHDQELTCLDENCGLKIDEQNGLYKAEHVYDEEGKCSCELVIKANENLVLIYDIEDLFDFAEAVNAGDSFSGKTIMLLADIDLAGEAWAPIGKDFANAFRGTFDGYGRTISNLTVEGDFAGFFGYMFGTVQNLTIDGAEVSGKTKIGVIAGYSYGSIIGCTVKDATVNCIDDSATAEDGDKAGAIVGYLAEGANSVVKNNTVEDVTITANRDAGFVVGCANANSVVEGNVYYGVEVIWSNYGTEANLGNAIGRDLR